MYHGPSSILIICVHIFGTEMVAGG